MTAAEHINKNERVRCEPVNAENKRSKCTLLLIHFLGNDAITAMTTHQLAKGACGCAYRYSEKGSS